MTMYTSDYSSDYQFAIESTDSSSLVQQLPPPPSLATTTTTSSSSPSSSPTTSTNHYNSSHTSNQNQTQPKTIASSTTTSTTGNLPRPAMMMMMPMTNHNGNNGSNMYTKEPYEELRIRSGPLYTTAAPSTDTASTNSTGNGSMPSTITSNWGSDPFEEDEERARTTTPTRGGGGGYDDGMAFTRAISSLTLDEVSSAAYNNNNASALPNPTVTTTSNMKNPTNLPPPPEATTAGTGSTTIPRATTATTTTATTTTTESKPFRSPIQIHAETTALLVVDVQPEYWSNCPAVRKDFPHFPSSLQNTVAICRQRNAKIIWIRANYQYSHSPWLRQFERLHGNTIPAIVNCDPHSSGTAWEDFATPQGGDVIIPKTSWSSTTNTALMDVLRQSNIDTVLVCGLITSVCVQHSAFGIFEAGYRTLLVTDACADRGRARHEAALALYGDYMYELVTSTKLQNVETGLIPAKPVWYLRGGNGNGNGTSSTAAATATTTAAVAPSCCSNSSYCSSSYGSSSKTQRRKKPTSSMIHATKPTTAYEYEDNEEGRQDEDTNINIFGRVCGGGAAGNGGDDGISSFVRAQSYPDRLMDVHHPHHHHHHHPHHQNHQNHHHHHHHHRNQYHHQQPPRSEDDTETTISHTTNQSIDAPPPMTTSTMYQALSTSVPNKMSYMGGFSGSPNTATTGRTFSSTSSSGSNCLPTTMDATPSQEQTVFFV